MAEPEFLERGPDRIALHVHDEDARGPLAVVWPAMGVPARYYRPFVAELRAAGLGAVVVDLRGTGASTPRPSRRSRYGYAALAGDVGAVLDALKPRLDGRRVVLVGHSLGGQACVLHLALAGDALAGDAAARVLGLVLVAVGLPWYRLYPGGRSATVLAFTQGIVGAAAALRVWPGWGFGGRQSYGVMRDWGFTARHGRFPRIGGADAESALGTIRTPVLAISVDHDQYTPAPTTDHLVAKMSAAPVERVHVTSAEAGAPLDHFAWVRASAPIARRVAAFAAPT
jgi:predicted alpha/beta hydrolase